MAGQKRSLGHGAVNSSSKAPRHAPPPAVQSGFSDPFGHDMQQFPAHPHFRSMAASNDDNDPALSGIYESESPISAKPSVSHGNGGDRPMTMAAPLHAAPVRCPLGFEPR